MLTTNIKEKPKSNSVYKTKINNKKAKEQSQTDAGHLKELKKTQDELREQLKIVYDKNHELQTVVTELNKS